MPGKFIVFEGGEGTGKSTQIKLLETKLREQGFLVYLTREPGGNGVPLGEKIRQILKDPENSTMAPETELFLFLASRAQHVKKHIMPHLELNYIVICDRFFGSTLAYQHFGRGLFNLDEVKKINSFATGGLIPTDSTAKLWNSTEKSATDFFPSAKANRTGKS
jgi:dTMP kinase